MFNLLIILFAFINAIVGREYSMIPDLDEYLIPDKPIEYSFDTNEYNELFQKEYHNYDDTRNFNKQGKKLTKVDLMPEQCRGSFHNAFTKSTNYSMKIHEDSMVALRVCKNLLKNENINYEQLGDYLNKINVPKEFCPYAQKIECKKYSKYRNYDGSCNNLIQPFVGKSETPLKRLHMPRYHDMMSDPVKKSVSGKLLTNPRMIAYSLNYPSDIEIKINTLFVFWGQFVDHDLSLTGLITGEDKKPKACTCDSKDPDCLNIPIPKADPIIKNQKCMVTPRSSASFPKFNCKLGIREQVNLLSHYCDMSQVYGVTKDDNAKIRLGKDGLLKASAIPGIRYEHLPIDDANSTLCASGKKGARCFKVMETRSNQNLGILSLHTLWLREHNRIARTLKYLNPYWNDEKIFQEARRICIAQYQHIIYKGWIPLVLGNEMTTFYDSSVSSDKDYFYGYDRRVNPHISNEFTTAAFRFGHTLITSFVVKADTSLNLIANLSLTDQLLNTQEAYKNFGLDGILRGLLRQKSTANDGHFTNTLNNELFKNPDKNAETHVFSLSGLNINRGRDHGLAPYTSYRKLCGLHVPNSFDEMSYIHSDSLEDLKKVYDHVDDIDLFSGGITEKPVEGGLVGPVFASIIAKQWRDLKYGDRHYYENGHDKETRFSLHELNEIRKSSMGRLLCDNIDIDYVPKNPWLVDSYDNPLVSCDSLPRVNLRIFKHKY